MNSADTLIILSNDIIEVSKALEFVVQPSIGGSSCFVGTTRDHFNGKKVVKLEYEAYISMAESEIKKIIDEAHKQWPVARFCVMHRLGEVPVGEASIIVCASSEHRKECMHAVEYVVDSVKATVPIWKKEVYDEGAPAWKENKECAWKIPQKD